MSSDDFNFEEEFDLTSEDGEDVGLLLPSLANDNKPGMVGLVEYGDVESPTIENGRIIMPRNANNDVPLADYAPLSNISIPGIVRSINFYDKDSPQIDSGDIKLPLAHTVDSSGNSVTTVDSIGSPVGSSVAGGIAGIRWLEMTDTNTHIDKPRILPGGIIEIPRNANNAPLASYDPSSGSTSVAGLIVSVDVNDKNYGVIDSGNMKLPLACAPGTEVPSPGCVAGIEDDTTIAEPIIDSNGVIKIPKVTNIKGVKAATGGLWTWDQIQSGAGSELDAAFVMLPDYNLKLSVGLTTAGFLTFTLSEN